MCTFWGGLLQELGRICVLWNWNKGVSFMAVPIPAVLPCSFPSHLLCCFTPRAVPCTFCGANQAGEKYSTSLNSSAHQFSNVQFSDEELNWCLFGAQVGGVQLLHKPAHRAAVKLGATPNWECGLWVCSWVFLLRSMNSQVRWLIPRSRYVQYQY